MLFRLEEQISWVKKYISEPNWYSRWELLAKGTVQPQPSFEEQLLRRI